MDHDVVICEPKGIWTFRLVAGFTIGFVLLGLIWLIAFRGLPRQIDREGVTLRNGKRFAWRDLAKVQHRKTVAAWNRELGVDYSLWLIFPTGVVTLNPGELKNGLAALRFVESVLGVDAQQHLAQWQRRGG